MAYESPKFMLPIRLGMVNADGQQELFVYALTRKGRMETTNYRTVKLPSEMDLPVYLKEPGRVCQVLQGDVRRQVEKEGRRVLFLEYAWDMAGAIRAPQIRCRTTNCGSSASSGPTTGRGEQAPEVFVTRLHVRYDKAHFPEDLVFQETADRTNSRAVRAASRLAGDETCGARGEYREPAPAARAGSRAPGIDDWVGVSGDPQADGARRGGVPGAPAGVVGTAVEQLNGT